MLLLTRKKNEKIILETGSGVKLGFIEVCSVRGGYVNIGLEMLDDIKIYREELLNAINKEKLNSFV